MESQVCLIYFRYLGLCFMYTSRLQDVNSDRFVQSVCQINSIRNNLDVFHYEYLTDYVVLVDACTISSQCYFDYTCITRKFSGYYCGTL